MAGITGTFTNITRENAAYYAAVVYQNPHFTREDQLYKDLRKISIIKKHMNKFDMAEEDVDIQNLVRKITNNIITFLNMFGTYSGMRLLFVLTEERFWGKLVPILELVTQPETPMTIEGVSNSTVILENVEIDEFFSSFVNNMVEYSGLYNKNQEIRNGESY